MTAALLKNVCLSVQVEDWTLLQSQESGVNASPSLQCCAALSDWPQKLSNNKIYLAHVNRKYTPAWVKKERRRTITCTAGVMGRWDNVHVMRRNVGPQDIGPRVGDSVLYLCDLCLHLTLNGHG